jgi:uncharacterized repeat protein (TIGR03803 family)
MQILRLVILGILLAGCSSGSGSSPPITALNTTGRTSATMQRSASSLGLVPSGHSSYELLYAFEGAPDGEKPAGLVDVGGTLYGVTQRGGAYSGDLGHGNGTVFSITASGKPRIIYSFQGGADGIAPQASLVNVNGTLYGTTGGGGTESCSDTGLGCGTVFSITPAGEERVIYSFKGSADGTFPTGLIAVHDILYGTTSFQGDGGCPGGCGTVFAVTTSGKERVLYQFKGGSDGFSPNGGLVDVNGTLYGTTRGGGGTTGCDNSGTVDPSCGTVFSVNPSGEEHVVHRFQAGTDATNPTAGLIDVCGTLYGTAVGGGAFGQGTVYTVSRSGKESVLYSFKGGLADGAYPWSLLTDVDGTFYGTTQGGGASSSGTVFKISKSGTETVLYMFKGSPDGSRPFTGVTDVHGTLYGTTYTGGTTGCGVGCGTVYALKL